MKLKKALLVLLRLCLSSDYRVLRRLKVFDPGYYLRCRKGDKEDIDPLWTYIKSSPKEQQRFLEEDGGWRQLADPHPLFDTAYYLLTYFPDGIAANPFVHYLTKGWKDGYHPGPFFDPDVYGKRAGWNPTKGDPLSHYIHHGKKLCLSPSLSFDYGFYFDKNPVFGGPGQDDIRYYKLHTASIGKTPLPLFDPQYYLDQLGTKYVAYAQSDPLSHYLAWGARNNIQPAPFFDGQHYSVDSGGEVTPEAAFLHYLRDGVSQKRIPHKRVTGLAEKPVISILVPVYNPDPSVLRNCIRSVLYQAYPYWELCLVDDCSTNDTVRPLMEEWGAKDPRIKILFQSENGGIARTTNSAAQLATGSYLGFLDNDDELSVDCLLEVAEAICREGADLVYSDEDLIGDDGTRLSNFRKPAFNKGLLLSHNYITHFVAVKRSLFNCVGGLDSRFDGAQDFDLMLKLENVSETVVHIPKILYHWRASETSTSINHQGKSYAQDAGEKALEAALGRKNLPLRAAPTELNYYYRLQASSHVKGSCTVIVWAAGSDILSRTLIESIITGCRGLDVKIVIAVEESLIDEAGERFENEIANGWQVVTAGGKTRAAVVQQLAAESTSDYICLLDGSIEHLHENWLTELMVMTALNDVAIVCGRTRERGGDGRSYLLPDLLDDGAIYFRDFLTNCSMHMAGLHCMQDMSFAGWHMSLISREVFGSVGGFPEVNFPGVFFMAELSLRLTESGRRIVYTPYAIAEKKEPSPTHMGEDSEAHLEEKRKFQKLLREKGTAVLPYYNRSLLVDNGYDLESFDRWLMGGN